MLLLHFIVLYHQWAQVNVLGSLLSPSFSPARQRFFSLFGYLPASGPPLLHNIRDCLSWVNQTAEKERRQDEGQAEKHKRKRSYSSTQKKVFYLICRLRESVERGRDDGLVQHQTMEYVMHIFIINKLYVGKGSKLKMDCTKDAILSKRRPEDVRKHLKSEEFLTFCKAREKREKEREQRLDIIQKKMAKKSGNSEATATTKLSRKRKLPTNDGDDGSWLCKKKPNKNMTSAKKESEEGAEETSVIQSGERESPDERISLEKSEKRGRGRPRGRGRGGSKGASCAYTKREERMKDTTKREESEDKSEPEKGQTMPVKRGRGRPRGSGRGSSTAVKRAKTELLKGEGRGRGRGCELTKEEKFAQRFKQELEMTPSQRRLLDDLKAVERQREDHDRGTEIANSASVKTGKVEYEVESEVNEDIWSQWEREVVEKKIPQSKSEKSEGEYTETAKKWSSFDEMLRQGSK